MKSTSQNMNINPLKRRLRLSFSYLAIFALSLAFYGNVKAACPIKPDAFMKMEGLESEPILQIINQNMEELYQRFYCIDRRLFFENSNYVLSENESLLSEPAKQRVQGYRLKHNMSEYKSELRDAGGDLRRKDEFLKKFNAHRNMSELPVSKLKYDDFEIVLVAGFGNEAYRVEYFSDMISVLKDTFSVPEPQIHIVFSNSFAGADVSINLLFNQYKMIKAKSPEHKIMMLGHSRGGLLIVNTLIEHPEIVEDPFFNAAVTIQSPLKGTPTAEFLEKKATGLNSVVQFFCKSCSLGRLQEIVTGAHSMASHETHQVVKSIDRLTEMQLGLISQKLFYVSSYSYNQSTKLGAHIIDEKNDGTVPLASQYIRSFGRKLALLPDIGHTDLVISGSKSDLTAIERQIFSIVLFEQLGDPNTHLEDGMD